MVNKPDKKTENTIFDDVFVEEPQPKSTGRSFRFKFTKYVSLELQRTSIITLVCIIYLTLGGYIFQELERPDAEENCKDKMRELNETLPGMLDRIGDSYYEMLVSLRTVNSSSEQELAKSVERLFSTFFDCDFSTDFKKLDRLTTSTSTQFIFFNRLVTF